MKKEFYIRLFCIIFIVYFPLTTFGQTEAGNLKKYWDYRDRLKKYFMKIGNGPGESIPSENINIGGYNGNTYMRWGDATIHIGYYIAVLASEYKLLYDAQQFDEAQKTKNELYYAIQCANRLDFYAEPFLSNVPGSYNGFLIRDDVEDIFKDNWSNQAGSANQPWEAKKVVDYVKGTI